MRTKTLNRRQTSFRLYDRLLDKLKKEAARNNKSLNNYVENILMDSVEWTLNAETRKAFDDIEHRRNLEVLDVDNFKNFVASL